MTENLGGTFQQTEEQKAQMDPQWVATVVTWLASPESKDMTGRVVETSGLRTAIAEGWRRGPEQRHTARLPGRRSVRYSCRCSSRPREPTSMLGI